MHGGEGGDLAGLHGGLLRVAERTADHLKGVADMPELGVELVVVPRKKSCRHLSRYKTIQETEAGGQRAEARCQQAESKSINSEFGKPRIRRTDPGGHPILITKEGDDLSSRWAMSAKI